MLRDSGCKRSLQKPWGRAPDTPALSLVPPEWLEVIGEILKRPRPLHTVREFMRSLAGLGGFLG